MNKEVVGKKYVKTNYGYKLFAPLFCDGKLIKYQVFISLLINLKKCIVYHPPISEKSTLLDNKFLSSILQTIENINESSSKFEEFIIANPEIPNYDSLTNFITKNQRKFNSLGWKLEKTIYSNPFWGHFTNTLSINNKSK